MKKLHIVVLLCVGLAAATAFVLRNEKKFVSQEVADTEKLAFPGFSANGIHTMVVHTRFDTLTFKKEGERWAIEEKNGYLADPLIINQILSVFTDLKVVQKTTVDESRWTQIGVRDPRLTKEGSGCRVDILGSGGYQSSVIVGSLQASNSEASLMFGKEFDGRSFIRKTDSDTVYLVDQSLSFFNTIPSKWIMNILSNPRAYKRIIYVDEGKQQWKLARKDRSVPYQLYGESDASGVPVPNLSTTADYTFASMITKDVFPKSFERSTAKITGDRYFELEALDGFTQRIYLGKKTKISDEERSHIMESTGVVRKVLAETYRYAALEWKGERIDPPQDEPPYLGRTYLIHCPKMSDYMISHDEVLVLERLSPATNTLLAELDWDTE